MTTSGPTDSGAKSKRPSLFDRVVTSSRRLVDPALAAFSDPARLAFGSWQQAFRRDGRARVGTALVVVLVILAIGGALTPPIVGHVADAMKPPSAAHPFGTDGLGRDLLLAILQGSSPTLGGAALGALGAAALGTALGALGGYLRGTVDLVVHRAIEALTAIPLLLLVILIQALIPWPGGGSLMIVIVLTRWAAIAQIVRSDVLRVVQLDHVVAARALGAGPGRILARHVLPSVLASGMVLAAFGVGTVVLLETAVAAVGVGTVHPLAWGALLAQARRHPESWWLVAFPSIFLILTLSATVLLGEAMRDALDPRMRHVRPPV
jgi:peptide/nickel transport system permease protein